MDAGLGQQDIDGLLEDAQDFLAAARKWQNQNDVI
jgi:hypothetical protein